MNKQLYNIIINDIAKIVKKQLNEMSKNISFRNIDRKLWLSVASVCSKNKSTEAEFVKPMKKLTKDDLLQRYVAALLIMKKPCPKTKKDIDTLKTFKLFAQKALELGANISDIKDLYDQNNNAVTATKKQIEKPLNVSQAPVTPSVQQKPKVNKYTELLNGFIINLSDRLKIELNHENHLGPYKLETENYFKACQPQLETYINNLIKKSHNSINKFLELLQKDCQKFFKVINIQPTYFIDIKKYVGETWSTFDSYNHYLNIKINDEKIDIYFTYENNSFSKTRIYRNPFHDEQNIMKSFTKYMPNIYLKEKGEPLNLLLEFSKELFINIIKPYVDMLVQQLQEKNKLNSASTLKKYNMQNKPQNLQSWAQNNLYNILRNNPSVYVYVNYGDWNGGVKYIYYDYNKNKYFVGVYCENSNSDHDDTDYLNNLLNSSRTYRFDANYNNYYCSIHDLDSLYETIYNKIYELINNGKIK